jgi:hypothetical protein
MHDAAFSFKEFVRVSRFRRRVKLMKLRLVEAKKAKGSNIGEIAITRTIY